MKDISTMTDSELLRLYENIMIEVYCDRYDGPGNGDAWDQKLEVKTEILRRMLG